MPHFVLPQTELRLVVATAMVVLTRRRVHFIRSAGILSIQLVLDLWTQSCSEEHSPALLDNHDDIVR